MKEADAVRLFKCLADKSRLQILQSLAQEEMYVERLAERLDLSAATVSFHLKKLADAGLVTSRKSQYYTMYALCRQPLEKRIGDILRETFSEGGQQAQRDAAYRQKVIDTFLQYGKLQSIPVQRKKERIVLEEIVKSFAFGRIYSEKEVNLILAGFHEDFWPASPGPGQRTVDGTRFRKLLARLPRKECVTAQIPKVFLTSRFVNKRKPLRKIPQRLFFACPITPDTAGLRGIPALLHIPLGPYP